LADRDGDGKVFEKELTNLIVAQIEGSRGRTAIQIGQQGPQLFAMLDQNGDSRLSARELDQSARFLARWDADRDGLVGLEELPDHFGLSIYPSAPPIARQFTLSYRYSSNDAPSPDERGPLWFRKMDRNRDRDVSRREFLGPLDDFASFDTDGDGRIDPAEAEAVSRESLAP